MLCGLRFNLLFVIRQTHAIVECFKRMLFTVHNCAYTISRFSTWGSAVRLKLGVMSDSNLLLGISAAYYIIANAKKKREKKRSKWIKNYFKTRNFGIINDLQLDEDFLFGNFTRMSKTNFFSLLKMIEPEIVKQNTKFREAVPPNIKLLITLRYLATGDSFSSLMYLFRVSKQYISAMLPVVLKAIVKALKKYIKVSG